MTDTNPRIKKVYIHIKIIFSKKAAAEDARGIIYNLKKAQILICVNRTLIWKNKNQNTKFRLICEHIHFNTYIYIYIYM